MVLKRKNPQNFQEVSFGDRLAAALLGIVNTYSIG